MTARAERSGKIAILVPTFNGGRLLLETLASAATAGLPADSYEFVVCDNASDDGSTDHLPGIDTQGAAINLRRNRQNIGRVQNWNRAVEAAEELGFGHAIFLMVGDTLKGATVLDLRDRMNACNAALGLASYEVVDEKARALRVARRINWRGDRAIAPGPFLRQSFGRGAMLYAPLGANLYRIDGAVRLRFDAGDTSHTDQRATARYAAMTGTPIVYLDHPISCWRQRSGRFHSSMAIERRLRRDLRVIFAACHEAGVEPDYPKIRATLLLRCCFHRRALRGRSVRRAFAGGKVSWSWLARLLYRQLLFHTPWLIEP